MKINFKREVKADRLSQLKDSIVILMDGFQHMQETTQALDQLTNGLISRAMKSKQFKSSDQSSLILNSPQAIKADSIILHKLDKKMAELDYWHRGADIFRSLDQIKSSEVHILSDKQGKGALDETAMASIAAGVQMANYRFIPYLSAKDKAASLHNVTVYHSANDDVESIFNIEEAVISGVNFTRDLVSEPPNILYPETFAGRVQDKLPEGLTVEILDEEDMQELNMHALLGVGQGSSKESRLVILQWQGGNKNDAPIAFVGKGVTFDTGGISLKPGPGMEEMKWDMGGAGVVSGLMFALANRKAKTNVVGILGLAENMPDGKAQRPGDIVRAMSGTTIEIHNTDAEGRLVLADALWYTQERFKPKYMIDLATLTGAMVIALGHEYAGFFSNDDRLSKSLEKASNETGEKLWRMPLDKNYAKLLQTDAADLKNIGGRGAGAITAAQFLEKFIGKTKWAHLDIAGVTWQNKQTPLSPRGASGFGVRLLDRLVRNISE